MRYAIIDIETTGGNHRTERITEIAIYVHDGEKIVDEYATLINPEKHIPPFISGLTGITNQMVENAPKFFEVAKEIVLKTEDTIFVAHNANFDYSFIKNEFKQLGFNFNKKTLDTVRLSRKLLPGHASYSLGKICNDLGIKINGRHRAAGDALATVKLFEILLSKNEDFEVLANPEKYKLLKGIDDEAHKTIINSLPEKVGVYYFFDDDKKLIYIGKSLNVKQRVAQHLRNNKGKKSIEMKARIAEVHFELTGSELVALLLESAEIKKYQPIYNRSQRRTLYSYGLYSSYNLHGYIELKIEKISNKHGEPVATFTNKDEVQNNIYKQIEKYNLCQKLCGLYKSESGCFHYGIKKCNGACIQKESNIEYNKRALEFIQSFKLKPTSFFIVDKGKNDSEKAIIQICNGKYMGFGCIDAELVENKELMTDCIKKHADNRDVQHILNSFIRNRKFETLIEND